MKRVQFPIDIAVHDCSLSLSLSLSLSAWQETQLRISVPASSAKKQILNSRPLCIPTDSSLYTAMPWDKLFFVHCAGLQSTGLDQFQLPQGISTVGCAQSTRKKAKAVWEQILKELVGKVCAREVVCSHQSF